MHRLAWLIALVGCGSGSDPGEPRSAGCLLVEEGAGPTGQDPLLVEVVATGLEVPWGLAFLDAETLLVTERPGRVRLVQGGVVRSQPVVTLDVAALGEGGLLGIATQPDERRFFLYASVMEGGSTVNRVEGYLLADDGLTARSTGVVQGGIPATTFHDGGRIAFGPDGMLYVGTGDAGEPAAAQDLESLAGKLLRITADGEIPPDNPSGASPIYLSGLRNPEGFDWIGDRVVVADHGPSGELGRRGHDEVSLASAGEDLGWPTLYGCGAEEGMVTPLLSWVQAVPPGGAAVFRGPGPWNGNLIIGVLGGEHLHRVVFDAELTRVERHEVYLAGEYGRLRAVVMGPDGALYVTTSNCDGRGDCPRDGDRILRIRPPAE